MADRYLGADFPSGATAFGRLSDTSPRTRSNQPSRSGCFRDYWTGADSPQQEELWGLASCALAVAPSFANLLSPVQVQPLVAG